MAAEIDEVLAVWRAAERALDTLPEEAPERPVMQIQVARLRRYYARLTEDSAPASWRLVEAAHDTIAETRRLLGEARRRIETTPRLARTERLMKDWLVAEQVLSRAAHDAPERSRLVGDADAARERYQAAVDALDPAHGA